MPSPCSVAFSPSHATITLDDGKANAIGPDTMEALNRALDQAEERDLAVLLVGRPGCFSAGLDLRVLPALDAEGLGTATQQFCDLVLRLFTFPRPVVAACTGHALAGGAVLLLCADERVAAAGPFKIGLSEARLGISLPRFVVEMANASLSPPSVHAALVRGDVFDPDGARQHGLVDEVVSAESVVSAAESRVAMLAALPRDAYRDNKAALRSARAEAGRRSFPHEQERFMQSLRSLRRS